MNKTADASGHIFSHAPCIIGYFGSFSIIRPPKDNPAEASRSSLCPGGYLPQPCLGSLCHIHGVVSPLLLSPSISSGL